MIVPCRHRSSNPQSVGSDLMHPQDKRQQVIPTYLCGTVGRGSSGWVGGAGCYRSHNVYLSSIHVLDPPGLWSIGQVGQYSGMFVQPFETELYLIFAKYYVGLYWGCIVCYRMFYIYWGCIVCYRMEQVGQYCGTFVQPFETEVNWMILFIAPLVIRKRQLLLEACRYVLHGWIFKSSNTFWYL